MSVRRMGTSVPTIPGTDLPLPRLESYTEEDVELLSRRFRIYTQGFLILGL